MGRAEKWCKLMIKIACRRTGLVPQHPKTIKMLQEVIDNNYHRGYYPWCMSRIDAKTMVKNYAK